MLIVYLPFVIGLAGHGALAERTPLTPVRSAREAKRVAEIAARGTLHFGFDKVTCLGRQSGELRFGPPLSHWSTLGRP